MAVSNYLPSSRVIQPGVCTSTTRPASPYEGQVIYETDTDKVLVWNGSAWYPNWNLPWGVLGTHTLSTGYTTTGTHTSFQDEGLTCSVAYGPSRKLKVTLCVNPYPSGGQQGIRYIVYRGTTLLTGFQFISAEGDTNNAAARTYTYVFSGPSTAATETFKVQIAAQSSNTAVTSYAGDQGTSGYWYRSLIVEDIGPA